MPVSPAAWSSSSRMSLGGGGAGGGGEVVLAVDGGGGGEVVLADVQLGVHGIGDELMLLGHVDSCDVLRKLVHCLLTFDQGWDRRKLLLHQWRHCWWNHGVMHLHFM